MNPRSAIYLVCDFGNLTPVGVNLHISKMEVITTVRVVGRVKMNSACKVCSPESETLIYNDNNPKYNENGKKVH